MTQHIQSLAGEIWKPVVGHEDRYLISTLGRVYSFNGGCRHKNKGAILKPSSAKGYLRVKLHRPSKEGRIHQLVLLAFVGPRPNGTDACHNNGNSLDNRLENLRWATPKENIADTVFHGTKQEGARHYAAKFTEDEVRNIRKQFQNSGLPYRQFAEKLGIDQMTLWRIVNRKSYRNVV
jgi:predicted DNA-binding protein (UPF0251 family)